jgi:2-polyprenyl-6-methoxyphenol hydroxylase-like FAD-dependent oxidoreductase
MQIDTDAQQRLFNNDATVLKWLRNTGLSMTDRVAPLKRMLVEHALG